MAKKTKVEKTNAARILDSRKADYQLVELGIEEAKSAEEVANLLDVSAKHVYKTLVTEGKSKEHYVFVIPADSKLDLKKAAKAAGEKSIAPIRQQELLPLTGYVHGGCSPIGMKKQFKTFIQQDSQQLDYFFFSAGKIGFQIKTNYQELSKVVQINPADLIESANQ